MTKTNKTFSLLLVLAGLSGKPSTTLILAVLAVRSVGTALHQPSLGAVIPMLPQRSGFQNTPDIPKKAWTYGVYRSGRIVFAALYACFCTVPYDDAKLFWKSTMVCRVC